MEVKLALVTVARRYCLERAPELLPADFDPEEFQISPSITPQDDPGLDTDALEWVLVALEGVDVDRFSTFGELQSHLIWVIQDASRRYIEFWHTNLGDDTRNVLDALGRYIAEPSTDALRDVKPLPYRRPLAEVWEVWGRITEKWKLPARPPPRVDLALWRRSHADADVLVLDDVEAVDRAIPPRALRSILGSLGVTRIWKLDLPEESWSFEMDLAWVDTRCDWGECYWVPTDLAWIMYASHEGEFIIEGIALLKRIRAAWNA